jgi:hypothetical protein
LAKSLMVKYQIYLLSKVKNLGGIEKTILFLQL